MPTAPRFPAALVLLLLLAALVAAPATAVAQPPPCAGSVTRSDRPPGTTATVRQLATWLAARPAAELDRVLLTPAEIRALNDTNAERVGTWQDILRAPARTPRELDAELALRFEHIRPNFESGHWVEARRGALGAALTVARSARPAARFHLVVLPADLRCVPEADGFFTVPVDPDFDRNRCSVLHLGELVRVDRESPDGAWLYVHAGHGVGWLHRATLTPPLTPAEATAFRDGGVRLVPLDDWLPTAAGAFLRLGTSYPIVARGDGVLQICVPTVDGLRDDFIADDAAVHIGSLPLTRRNILEVIMRRVNDVYGWGGTGGGRDCSQLLLDTFAAFGLHLGRNSSVQGQSGARTVEVAGLDARAKRAALRRADADGVVFVYLPGHIMLYLGERDGVPWALSAISEYLVPCPGGGDRTVRLDRVDVTTLELGRGTERTAYLERIARLAVFSQ